MNATVWNAINICKRIEAQRSIRVLNQSSKNQMKPELGPVLFSNWLVLTCAEATVYCSWKSIKKRFDLVENLRGAADSH